MQDRGIFLRYVLDEYEYETKCPGKRVYLLLLFGITLSIIGMEVTSDEYYIGGARDYSGGANESNGFEITFYNLKCEVSLNYLSSDADFTHNEKDGSHEEAPKQTYEKRSLINKVSGKLSPGRLTAVLGQSGSGKTTLLMRLLGRSKAFCDHEEGDVFINGNHEWNGLESVVDKVGYVPQFDVLYSDLTVLEVVQFSANWRLPKSIDHERKQLIVNEILTLLQIDHIKHYKIGSLHSPSYGYGKGKRRSSVRQISGGERKRVSIAVELVANPKILLLDEPTSGLDSTSALSLISILKEITTLGVTILVILHQPSQRIFDLVDDLILMQDGEAAFVGEREEVPQFFTLMGYNNTVVPGEPSAEGVLDTLANLIKPVSPPAIVLAEVAQAFQASQAGAEGLVQSTANDHGQTLAGFTYQDLQHCFENFLEQHCVSSVSHERFSRLAVLFRVYSKLKQKGLVNTDFATSSNASVRTKLKETLRVANISACSWSNDADASPMPGFKTQFTIWLNLLLRLGFRKSVSNELLAVISLAIVVGFVAGYNRSWSRKPMANLFLSLSIGLLGSLGSVFTDDIEPVHRAANSGMLLGAHEFALLGYNLIKGWAICHIFSFSYFVALYVKTNVFVFDDDSEDNSITKFVNWKKFNKYYEFAHINHLHYVASSAVGSALCVFSNHDIAASHVLSIAVLITFHVFACFSPNRNQLMRDSIMFSYDFGPLLHNLSQLIYVTHFLEAIYLWDPEAKNARARKVVMRYYSYQEKNKSYACTCMFGLWTLFQILRYNVFVLRNSNEFHTLHDSPLFVTSLGKALICHIMAFSIMACIQEAYYLRQVAEHRGLVRSSYLSK